MSLRNLSYSSNKSIANEKMAVNVIGIVGIVIFYLIILLLGIWAGCKKSKREDGNEVDETKEVMLAGRGIGLFVGCFTMTGRNHRCFFCPAIQSKLKNIDNQLW